MFQVENCERNSGIVKNLIQGFFHSRILDGEKNAYKILDVKKSTYFIPSKFRRCESKKSFLWESGTCFCLRKLSSFP